MPKLPFRKTLRSACLLIASLIAPCAVWAQVSPTRARVMPDFDVRETAPAAQSPRLDPRPGLALVERRVSTLENYSRTSQATAPGTRLVSNRYGVPKMMLRDGGTLSSALPGQPAEAARTFLRSRPALFPFSPAEIDGLRVAMLDSSGGATSVAFVQTVNGLDVFNGQIKVTMTAKGEVVQVASGDAAPGLTAPAAAKIAVEDAVRAAYRSAGAEAPATLSRLEGQKIAFQNPRGAPYSPVTAELMVFPLDAVTARLAYRISLETGPDAWYEILIDAEDAGLLFRHNAYVNQANGSARVWKQSPAQGSRELVNFPAGWLNVSATMTTGNNVDAALDTDANDRPDSTNNPNLATGRAFSTTGVFDFDFADGLTGRDPRLYQPAAVTNLFYFVNIAHDYFYNLGFTETAANFQTDNAGRGGTGNDAVLAFAQNPLYANNAAFAPTIEGTAPKLRVGIFTRGTSPVLTDDLDADYDGGVIIHEYAHGVSTRLVGAGTTTSCLSRTQSGALGEGWSDYFGISYYNNPITGAYLTQNTTRGIRRYSYEGYPYTYEDFGNQGYEVHNDGEIWAAALWDLRTTLGQSLTDALVFNGIKGTPCNPTMLDARDAILSADQAANAGANRSAIWTVFARHGMGYSASATEGNAYTGTRYDAAYDKPAEYQTLANPKVTSNPLSVVGSMGSQYSYTIVATNPNNGVLSYSAQAPSDLAVDAAGAVTFVPPFIGPRVKLTIIDGKGGKVVHGYRMPVTTVLASGAPITVSASRSYTGYAKIDIPANTKILQATLRGSTGNPDLYVYDPDLTMEVSIRDGANETLTFANPKAGTWIMQIPANTTYSDVALEARAFTPPVLGPNATVSGMSGVIGSEALYRITIPSGATAFNVTTTGGTGDVDIFLRRDQPALCQLQDVSTDCYADAWSMKDGNEENIKITNPVATDYYLDVSGFVEYSGVTLTTALTRLTITTAPSLPAGRVGTAYSQTLAARDGVIPYTWSLASGSLPGGLSLSSAGVISGTPTARGTFTFSVKVTDNAVVADTVAFTIIITKLTITTAAALPAGQVGTQYSQTIAAGDGTTPYTWSLASGSLPPGLTLSSAGVISGAPTTQGTYTFSIKVTDSASSTDTVEFTLAINAATSQGRPRPQTGPGGIPGTGAAGSRSR